MDMRERAISPVLALSGTVRKAVTGIAAAVLVIAPAAAGQETSPPEPAGVFPGHGYLLTGYGTAGYNVVFEDEETPNDFVASVNPILLFQISDRFLFEAEVEFELEEGVTETGLEYAQIDYTLSNDLKLVAGKFLLPFNIFSERLHPSWIHKFASSPPLYGHGAGTGPTAPLLPVLTDVGVQLRGTFDVGKFGYLTGVAFVTQGPTAEAEEHAEEAETGEDLMEESGQEEMVEIPEVAFGQNFEDANENKMVGGRLGVGLAPYVEVNVSAMSGDYDEEGRLRFSAYGAHLELRHRGLEVHSEWIRTEQEVAEHENPEETVTLVRDGYFAHASYRIGNWEPVIGWGQIFDGGLEGETVIESGEQLALGFAYWFTPALVAKAEYLANYEDVEVDNNRLLLQWAFGF